MRLKAIRVVGIAGGIARLIVTPIENIGDRAHTNRVVDLDIVIVGLEQGNRNPTVVTLYELAQALGCSHVDLVTPDATKSKR